MYSWWCTTWSRIEYCHQLISIKKIKKDDDYRKCVNNKSFEEISGEKSIGKRLCEHFRSVRLFFIPLHGSLFPVFHKILKKLQRIWKYDFHGAPIEFQMISEMTLRLKIGVSFPVEKSLTDGGRGDKTIVISIQSSLRSKIQKGSYRHWCRSRITNLFKQMSYIRNLRFEMIVILFDEQKKKSSSFNIHFFIDLLMRMNNTLIVKIDKMSPEILRLFLKVVNSESEAFEYFYYKFTIGNLFFLLC